MSVARRSERLNPTPATVAAEDPPLEPTPAMAVAAEDAPVEFVPQLCAIKDENSNCIETIETVDRHAKKVESLLDTVIQSARQLPSRQELQELRDQLDTVRLAAQADRKAAEADRKAVQDLKEKVDIGFLAITQNISDVHKQIFPEASANSNNDVAM